MSRKKLLKKLYKDLTQIHVELEMIEEPSKEQKLQYNTLGKCIEKVE